MEPYPIHHLTVGHGEPQIEGRGGEREAVAPPQCVSTPVIIMGLTKYHT